MPGHDIVVIGASAGGVEALCQLVGRLPADLPAALFVVLHVPAHAPSVLPNILARVGPLPASHGSDGEPIEPGRIYVAPPDHHLLIRHRRLRVVRGPRENNHRPAIDPLFRTAACEFGSRVVGVILSGSLDDGTAGLLAIKACQGKAIVQDPDEALDSGMPRSAIDLGAADLVLSVPLIAAQIDCLARQPIVDTNPLPSSRDEHLQYEAEMAELDRAAIENEGRPGHPSGFACPDCGGALWELHEGELIRFRCRVGHAWSSSSLLARQADALESALWTALRALEESATLAERVADRLNRRPGSPSARRILDQAAQARQRADLIRQVLQQDDPGQHVASASPSSGPGPTVRPTGEGTSGSGA